MSKVSFVRGFEFPAPTCKIYYEFSSFSKKFTNMKERGFYPSLPKDSSFPDRVGVFWWWHRSGVVMFQTVTVLLEPIVNISKDVKLWKLKSKAGSWLQSRIHASPEDVLVWQLLEGKRACCCSASVLHLSQLYAYHRHILNLILFHIFATCFNSVGWTSTRLVCRPRNVRPGWHPIYIVKSTPWTNEIPCNTICSYQGLNTRLTSFVVASPSRIPASWLTNNFASQCEHYHQRRYTHPSVTTFMLLSESRTIAL